MKRTFNIILSVALSIAAVCALSSCKEDNLNPDDNEGGSGSTVFPEPLDHSDIQYPINWTPYVVEQGADGVSIEVTDVSMRDFTFICRPGSAVKSFKVCAFPLSGIYNYLINLDWTAGITADGVEQVIRTYIDEASSAGTTGYVGGADVTYNVEGDSDNEMEVVWSEAGYTYVPPVVPDAEYLIVAQAYYEADAQTQAAISICYVRTASRQLVGNPDLEIIVNPLYGGIELDYNPYSADAAGFYEFTGVKSEIEAYIDQFGERMYRDYVRNMTLQSAYPFEGDACPFPMLIPLTEVQAADAMATAVAVDVNGMPGELRTMDITTKEIPSEAQPASATVTVDQDHIGSLVFWLSADMDEYTREVDIRHMTVAQAEQYKNDDEARANLAASLMDEGWVIPNPNFQYDDETMQATGEGSVERAYRIDMKDILPNTEYVVAYVAVNYFGQAEDVYFTEPFTTKPRNIDNPDLYEGRFSVEIEDASNGHSSPIGFTVKFTYDPEAVAAYYWQVVSPTSNGQANDMHPEPWIPGFVGPDEKLNYSPTMRSEWMDYFFNGVDLFNNPLCNVWFYNWDDLEENGGTTVTNEDGTVTDQWTFADMVPGTTYEVIAVPEDWNGNVGPLPEALYTGTTSALNPGPNPQVQMTVQPSADGNGFTAVFNPISDVGRMLIMQATTANELSASWSPADLVSGKVKNDGLLNHNDIIATMRAAVIGDGTEGNTGGLSYYTVTEWPYAGTEPCILMCVPVGENDGAAVYGDLLYVIYDGSSLSYDIDDYL